VHEPALERFGAVRERRPAVGQDLLRGATRRSYHPLTISDVETIREQMLALQEQARRVLEEARASARLHRARCNFKKIPGNTYHLYRRDGDELYFSMLSPADWRGAPPHSYEGSYRLEADSTWTKSAAVRDRPAPEAVVQALLAGASTDHPLGNP
jgi:hypothetical protein